MAESQNFQHIFLDNEKQLKKKQTALKEKYCSREG